MAAEVRQPIQGVALNYSVPESEKAGKSFNLPASYQFGRRERTRTSDPLGVNEVLCATELHALGAGPRNRTEPSPLTRRMLPHGCLTGVMILERQVGVEPTTL